MKDVMIMSYGGRLGNKGVSTTNNTCHVGCKIDFTLLQCRVNEWYMKSGNFSSRFKNNREVSLNGHGFESQE